MNPNIFLVILNYNNAEETIRCVDSTGNLNCGENDFHIVVVDNGSTDDSFSVLHNTVASNTVLLSAGSNLGYAAGNNLGIRYAKEHGADFIVILNNDVILNRNSLDSCFDLLRKNNEIGIVCPAILNIDNDTIQSTGANIDFFKIKTILINYGQQYICSDEIIDCDYVGGACMVFRADLPDKIGYIPEDYFLFWEEADWCAKARRQGLKCVCTLKSYIRHKGSATIKRYSGLYSYFLERNRVLFSKRCNSYCKYILSLFFLYFRAVYRGFAIGKENFRLIKYYDDGRRNMIDRQMFPFIPEAKHNNSNV